MSEIEGTNSGTGSLRARIAGIGGYLPARIVTNTELAAEKNIG